MQAEIPYFWLRKISSHLQEHDKIPLFGNAPPFDWARFSALAAAKFGVPQLYFRKSSQQWLSAEELQEGMGDNVLVLPLKIGALSGTAFWMMSKETIAKIASWMMHGQTKARPLSSELLAEGFYRYLILQVLDAASGLEPLQKVSIQLSESSSMPETDAFCIDVEIDFDKTSCWGRLAITPELQKSWAEHFSQPPSDYIPTKISQITELCAGLKVGGVLLENAEWKKLKKGDFVLLDQGSYNPRKQTGAAYLMLGRTPLFQVKIKQNKIQLIDYAFMYEEEMEKHKGHEPQDNDFSGPAEQFPPAEEEAVTLKEMPVYLTVEIARLKITLEKLIQLVPGNLIELPIHPDQGVQLTVNGQLVGRAQLVHLGESLGIRILEVG